MVMLKIRMICYNLLCHVVQVSAIKVLNVPIYMILTRLLSAPGKHSNFSLISLYSSSPSPTRSYLLYVGS